MNPKTALLKVRCTPAELKAWKKAAKTAKLGKPVKFSVFVRETLNSVASSIKYVNDMNL